MSPELIGIIIAALVSLAVGLHAANSARSSASATAAAQEVASNREFQSAFLTTLSNELEKANKLNGELRIRLSVAEDSVDSERSRRRDVESKLEQLTETVTRLQALLALVPDVVHIPEVQAFLATNL